MPSKRTSVKYEKHHEAPNDNGVSEARAAKRRW